MMAVWLWPGPELGFGPRLDFGLNGGLGNAGGKWMIVPCSCLWRWA